MADVQMLAVWGSFGSAKTVTAVKLAQVLAAHKKSVIILMCSATAPAPQTLLPNASTEGKSLGELLALPTISQDAILSRCLPFGDSPHVSLLGYKSGDNPFTYAKYSRERALDLITLMRHLADYIIIDCDSGFSFDVLSAVALETADAVLRLCPADLKALSYFTSALPLLADGRYAQDKHIRVLSMVKPGQDSGEYHNAFGGSSYELPFVPELEEQFFSAKLADALCTKPAKDYSAAIQQIAADVLLGDGKAPVPKVKKARAIIAPAPQEKTKTRPGGLASRFATKKPADSTPKERPEPKERPTRKKEDGGGLFGKLRGGKEGK